MWRKQNEHTQNVVEKEREEEEEEEEKEKKKKKKKRAKKTLGIATLPRAETN